MIGCLCPGFCTTLTDCESVSAALAIHLAAAS